MKKGMDAVEWGGGGGESQLGRVALIRIYCKCTENENLFCMYCVQTWTIEEWSSVGVEYITCTKRSLYMLTWVYTILYTRRRWALPILKLGAQ